MSECWLTPPPQIIFAAPRSVESDPPGRLAGGEQRAITVNEGSNNSVGSLIKSELTDAE